MRFFLAVILLSTVCSAQDKVEQFAHAIARTEGYYVHGSLPSRCHNAGDLKVMSKHDKYPGQIGVCKGGHVRFANDAAGYAALRHEIEKILAGESHYYRQDMTLLQMGKFYAQNSRLWAKNLAHNLGVSPSVTLQEYFEIAPRIRVEMKPYPLGRA